MSEKFTGGDADDGSLAAPRVWENGPTMPSLTRRRLLAGVGVLAAAAGGAVIGALTASSGDSDSAKRSAPPPGPPGPLLSALERERALLAAVRASAGNAALASVTGPLVADHSEHEATLGGLLATYPTPSASRSASESSSPPPAAPTSVAALRQAEGAAAEEAAAESGAARGAVAAVGASISPSEATQAAGLR